MPRRGVTGVLTVNESDGGSGSDSFGQMLRRLRRAARLSQEELAGQAGLSAKTIGNMERGHCSRSYRSSLERLAAALGLEGQIRADFLAVGRGQPCADTNREDTCAASPAMEPVPQAVVDQQTVPRQLPVHVAHFAGRATELAALDGLLDQLEAGWQTGTAIISAIGGTAGIGKTTLALHWAHRIANRFPDGQLYVNLRGFDPIGCPVILAEAIRGFLDALAVPADRIPASLDSQAGLYRSLLAGKRMLVVLDNARDVAQVRPLLPGAGGCLVLVTSRNQLTGLAAAEGAHLFNLDVLSCDEARELLAHRLGASQVAATPEAVDELITLCARLPIALSVAAARVVAQPAYSLDAMVTALHNERGRLDALDTGEPASSLRAVFSWSYRQLGGQGARMFRLLGAHPGPDISIAAAASLAGVPADQAR